MNQQVFKTITKGTKLKVTKYGLRLDNQECFYLGCVEEDTGELGVVFSKDFPGTTHNLSGRLLTNTGRWIPMNCLEILIKEWD